MAHHMQPNEVQAILAGDGYDDNPKPPGPEKLAHAAVNAAAEELGISDEVSHAVKQLAVKYKTSPMLFLLETLGDPDSTKSAKMAAAQVVLPYLHGKLRETKAPTSAPSGVMEVPVATSMAEWMGLAGPAQAALKSAVRE